ncbi:MAG: PIN domain-containing protein [Pseudobdellovibrionaceae bacterium]
MVLVDTNVWIEHFRSTSPQLIELLMTGNVVTHEFILGELSLAHFHTKERGKILERLHALERIKTSEHQEVYDFSFLHKLSGKGIGWIDSHLLHACISQNLGLLTFDKNLSQLAKKITR